MVGERLVIRNPKSLPGIAEKTAMLGLLVLVSVAVVVPATRRCRRVPEYT